MKSEIALVFLSITCVILFGLRWITNWKLLNQENKTNFNLLQIGYSFSDLGPLMKHIALSEWKLWWMGSDEKPLKQLSNLFSSIIYTLIFLMIILVVGLNNWIRYFRRNKLIKFSAQINAILFRKWGCISNLVSKIAPLPKR